MSYEIIAISGKIGSGKDTVFDIIKRINPTYQNVKYAEKLKVIASILTGVPRHMFESQDFKAQPMTKEWGGMTYRTFLQRLGTDAMRNGLHDSVWVNALFADLTHTSKWVITDCRFPDEAAAVKARGGVVIRVNRGSKRDNEHISETALDNYDGFDYVIDNNGTLEELEENVRQIMDWIRKRQHTVI